MRRMACFLLFLLCVITSSASSEETYNSTSFKVDKIIVKGHVSISDKELLNLMGLHKGIIEKKTVTEGIRRAFKKLLFEDIIVELQHGGTLSVTVKEHRYIDRIRISGNAHFTESEIKKILPIKEMDILRSDIVKTGIERLKEHLRLRGFPEADVSIDYREEPASNRVDIYLHISEGRPLIVERILIEGFHSWLRDEMETKEGDIYDTFKVQEDLKRLISFLRGRGYHNPAVGPYTYADGVLTVPVRPGIRLDIQFQGNKNINTSELVGILPFSEAGDINSGLIEEASARIVSFYHEMGYAHAQVAPSMKTDGPFITVTFFIYEGGRYKVKNINISKTTISDVMLKNAMNLREGNIFNPDLLLIDTENIVELYRALGYQDARVVDTSVDIIEEKLVVISIEIEEGRRYYIHEILIHGNSILTREEISEMINIAKGSPYNELDIIDAKRRVLNAYRKRGYLNAVVQVEPDISKEYVRLVFRINEDEVSYFGKTIVRGNLLTKTDVIYRELNYKEGDPLNQGLIPELSKRLYQLGIFRDVDIKLLQGDDNRRDVLIEVTEGKPGVFEFGVGYEEYEQFRGFIDVSYRNLHGMNRRINFRTELSSLRMRFLLGYYEPYLFERPVAFRASLLSEFREEKNIDTGEISYRIKKYSAEASVEKNVGASTKAQLTYEFSIVNTYDVKPDVVLSKEDTGTLAISSIRPGILYDTRNNPFDPSDGILLGASLKIATAALLSETDFLKLNFHGNIYSQLSNRFVLALSLRGGIAQGFGDTSELPIVERFFLGGRNTVRGFSQDSLGPKGEDGTPTGGNVFIVSNIELRTLLGRGFGTVVFIDTGNVWQKTDDIDGRLRYTAGLGFRYKTPIGPIRIDYGHKLDRKEGESSGEIHFSIGHAF